MCFKERQLTSKTSAKSVLFIRMLTAILWKHAQIRMHNVSGIILTICELLTPVVVFLATIYAKSNAGEFDKVYINTSTHVNPIENQDLLTRLNVGSTMLLYAPDTQFTDELMRQVQLKLFIYNELIKRFPTKEKLIDYYNQNDHDGPTVVVLFKDIHHTIPTHLDYEIKIYEEDVLWNTNELFSSVFTYIPGMGSDTYLEKAFAATQAAMDISFIEMVTNSSFNTTLTYQEFPYPPHLNTDGVTTSFRFILPLITIISFIFICPVTLKRVVLEKSSGLKELQKIAGVKSWTLWFGWFINGIVLNALSAIAIAIILKHAVFSTKYPIIEHCNIVLLALFLLLYCSATITFFFAFSTCFHRGTLAMVFGVLLWIISYIIFVGVSPHIDVMGAAVKGLLLLFSPFALYFGYNTISLFEIRETDITFSNLFESPTTSSDDLSLGIVITVLLFDTIFYFLLTLYLDKIWPGPYGIAKPWYFLMEKIWKRKSKPNCNDVSPASTKLLTLEKSMLKPVVQLRNIKKSYDNNVAVNNLTLDIYQGAVTSLLGENGAGKSTTMSMIAGLTKADSGDICIDGMAICEYAEYARKIVSICTQHDLLYDELNVIQHLILFGRLKGLTASQARKQAMDLLRNTLRMEDKEKAFVFQLSGGMKRKLSLGISLMGDPQILILDEPTSGIDVEGRREIWELILSFKGKKTVFISTHFLEEAEYLSDYLAIMNHGELLCSGTPMYLKKHYEIGYKCGIICHDKEKITDVQQFIETYVPTENIQPKIDGFVCSFVDSTKQVEIPGFLEKLDEKKDNLAISYRLSCSTLEDLYLKVQDKGEGTKQINSTKEGYMESVGFTNFTKKMRHCYSKHSMFFKKKIFQYLLLAMLTFMIVVLTLWLGKSGFVDVSKDGTKIPLDISLYGNTDVYYSVTGVSHQTKIDEYFKSVIASSNSLATKVPDVQDTIIEKGIANIAHYIKRMVIAAEFVVEDENVTSVNIMHANKAYHGAPISINAVMNTLVKYYAGDNYSISTSNTPLHARTRKEQALSQSEFTNLFLWLTLLPIGPLLLISAVLCLPATEYIKSTRILDVLCGIPTRDYWVCNFLINMSCYVVITTAIVWVAYLLPIHLMDRTAMVYLYVILLLYGFACIPFAYMFTFTSSVESAYAKFLIVHIICAPIVASIFLVLEVSETYSRSLTVIRAIILTIEPHISLCVYLGKMSIKIISNHNWDIMTEDKKRFLCSENFKNHPCCNAFSQACTNHRAYIDYNFIIYVVIAAVTYMLILVLKDAVIRSGSRWLQCLLHKREPDSNRNGSTTDNKAIVPADTTDQNEILFNVEKVSKGYISLNLHRLRPRYTKAIKELTLKLAKGKCVGLLGVNGAGKSTSFRILTQEILPTLGKLEKTPSRIGYCPQKNALLDELTGRDMLQLYGSLRIQTSPEKMNKMIDNLLQKFDLADIADKPCGTYSGGNKRKLSTCISMIGFPPCILLDEPTSGVDPISRRELWDLIQGIKHHGECGILLTSHSMDECEALCDRVCILKKGELKAGGSIKDLKNEYCIGHVLSVKLKSHNKPDKINSSQEGLPLGIDETDENPMTFEQYLRQNFDGKNVKILGIHNAIMYVNIRNSTWSTIFKKMDYIKNKGEYIEDYLIKEASLEEVLIEIAKNNNNTICEV
ncbi:ABC transporter [Popillia japonica]|uniref:ABC transporter n=1 Tax=Popillia japonica TaxID=7064 RepID=A0AAW1ID99_POPJA